jgi:UDP-N-acetylglucosamine--N-acetylmuramyl-(pentapeptide) pyrophosphoryl-undecaprenol N-acetylglucosamine transferase
VYPALAILDALERIVPNLEVVYLGTSHGLEAQVVPERNITFVDIQAEGLLGKGVKQKLGSARRAMQGFWQARRALKRFRAEVVLGTGGYVTGPVGLAAVTLGIPLVLQEQNVWPGITNRTLARFARLVMCPFEESRQYFPARAPMAFVANPVPVLMEEGRDEARQALGISQAVTLLMGTGGSQGALALNRWMIQVLPAFIADPRYGMLWATGPRYYDDVVQTIRDQFGPLDTERIQIHPYFHQIAHCYRASDLFVGRAGAMTIADCLSYRLPMALVPSPNVSEDHQTKNARNLQAAGVALMIAESELESAGEERVLTLLKDPERRAEMAMRTEALSDPKAADKMAVMIRELWQSARRSPR